jgi:hypothetical protein
VTLSDEEEEVVRVVRTIVSEEEVADEDVRPVGRTLEDHEAGVCRSKGNRIRTAGQAKSNNIIDLMEYTWWKATCSVVS